MQGSTVVPLNQKALLGVVKCTRFYECCGGGGLAGFSFCTQLYGIGINLNFETLSHSDKCLLFYDLKDKNISLLQNSLCLLSTNARIEYT